MQMAPMLGADVVDQASSLNGINLSDADKAAIAIALTQGLQEIFGLGITAISEQRISEVLRVPTNVTFNAAQYSTAISGFATWATWMDGCTIQGGDEDDNELLSATELRRPFMGSTGAVNATVYADAVRLPSWVKNTMDPVETPRVFQLVAADNRQDFRFWNSPYIGDRAHMHHHSHASFYTSRNKTAGDPCAYFVEARYDPTTGSLPLYLRVNPMPAQPMPITFRVKRKPPVIVATDITGESLTVSGSLSPDATGRYDLIGTDDQSPPMNVYMRQGADVFQIRFEAGCWSINAIRGGTSWTKSPSSDPVGSYAPDLPSTGTATVTASGTDLVIPTDWHESILLPLAKKWLMSHPAFNNPSAAQNIMQQAMAARQILETFIPQISPTQGHYH